MNEPPIIVLECGLNGNGRMDLNKQLIQMGVEAAVGADYSLDKVLVKFQKRDPEISTPKEQRDLMRVSPVSGEYMRYIDYRHEIEFGVDKYAEIDHFCKTLGVLWFASVWDISSAQFMAINFPDVPYIKIPSAHITNMALIREAALHDGGLIISTGMSDADMIQDAFSEAFLRSTSLTMLACTSTYPVSIDEINLEGMRTLQKMYGSSATVGYSSHDVSPMSVLYAIVMGAQMVEVHITLDRSMAGSDQSASLERPALDLIFREAKKIPEMMGDGVLRIQSSEIEKMGSLRGN